MMVSCHHCGKAAAPAVCARCKVARYCGPDCQRAAWTAGHKHSCSAAGAAGGDSFNGSHTKSEDCDWPVRCPQELLKGSLPRLDRLDCSRAQELLCEGQAFVAPAEGMLGKRLLKWDFPFLQQHLPADQQYGVMLDEGSGKIVMSHSARNGHRQIPATELDASGNSDGDLNTSDQTRMTFDSFLIEAERYKSSGKVKLPYFGMHLLWRLKEGENGYLGQMDEEMADDLWSIKFDLIREWQEMNVLPLVQRFYLFAGLGGTLYHCHYDLQPNLHVQLTGRKRFVLFPPSDWRHLYPFPVHHDLDRRSMVDLDSPDSERFPNWKHAVGHLVELEPGDALYIPPFWWHHVQSVTPQTTSMAMWFFEHFPLSSEVSYGIGPLADDILLMRDLEEYIGKQLPVPGEEDPSKPRPVKAQKVADFVHWLLPRLGAQASSTESEPLLDMSTHPEKVEAMLLERMAERILSENLSRAVNEQRC